MGQHNFAQHRLLTLIIIINVSTASISTMLIEKHVWLVLQEAITTKLFTNVIPQKDKPISKIPTLVFKIISAHFHKQLLN